jgi:hypothetical protein
MFSIADKRSTIQCRHAGEWNAPAFDSGFLFSSDDVNRDVVLAGFAFLINFSLALTVSITQ